MRGVNLSEYALFRAVSCHRPYPTNGCVYFCGKAGMVKIGMTINVDTRIKQLSKKHVKKLPIIHTIKSDDIRCLEFRFHYHYRQKHLGHEWFAISENELEYIKKFNGPTDEMMAYQPITEPYPLIDADSLPF